MGGQLTDNGPSSSTVGELCQEVLFWVKKRKLPRLTLKCFKTGRRTQIQSSVEALGDETANGCLVLDRTGTTAERHRRELKTLNTVTYAFLPARQEGSLPS